MGRGGSKGLPGKNLREIGGLSLVGYKAKAALQSRYCSRLIVSSDSAEIRNEAMRHGAEMLFERPAELATDTASSNDVVLHAMDWIETHEGRRYDAIMLLEPSSPFARPEHFDEAVELFVARKASLVVGMRETEVASIFVGTLGADGSIGGIVEKMLKTPAQRRQDQAPEVTMNGALYLVGWDAMRKHRKIYADPAASYGIMMDRLHSIEIESAADLAYASYVIEHGMLDASPWRNPHDRTPPHRRRHRFAGRLRPAAGHPDAAEGDGRRRPQRHRLRHASRAALRRDLASHRGRRLFDRGEGRSPAARRSRRDGGARYRHRRFRLCRWLPSLRRMFWSCSATATRCWLPRSRRRC